VRWPARFDGRPAWLGGPVLGVAALSTGSGVAAYGVTVLIGDVAATFGDGPPVDTALAEIGMPLGTVGMALAAVRLASLGGLPVASLADRWGRRRVLLVAAAAGFALSAASSAAPGFWWYVALVALARPFLSAINAVAAVVAAEEVRSVDRSAAVAVIAAAYGLGSGVVAVGRGLLPGDPGFRPIAAAALVPLLLLPLLARTIREPAIAAGRTRARGLPGAVPRGLRGRVAVLALLVGALAVATGPAFTYLFVYGERVLGASPLHVATLVLAAGPVGLLGLGLGRWAADRFGRRRAAALSMVGVGGALVLAYGGSFPALAVGYLLSVLLASAFTPAQGSLAAELVPTAVRATLAGWITLGSVLGAVVGLATFGVLADLTGDVVVATRLLGALTASGAIGFVALPETRGVELEDLEDPEGPEASVP
jgi:MFS family permease